MKNQALYWKSFAFLALCGKRDLEHFNADSYWLGTRPPTDDETRAIIQEATELRKTQMTANPI